MTEIESAVAESHAPEPNRHTGVTHMTNNEKLAAICKDVVLAAFDSTADCDVGLSELRDAMEEIEWQEVLAEALRTPTAEQVREADAYRYDFDGHGWKYIDGGSGSDWQKRAKLHADAEPLFAMPLPTTDKERVLERLCHEHGTIEVSWMGEALAWRPTCHTAPWAALSTPTGDEA